MNQTANIGSEKAFERLEMIRKLFKDHKDFARVSECCHGVVPGKPGIDIFYSYEKGIASLRNLYHCNQIWICPICARQVTYKRRAELIERLKNWQGMIFQFHLTMRHNRGQKLEDLFKLQNKAYDLFKSGKWYQEFKKNYQIVGNVTGREVTWSSVNGWHPHLHVLAITKLKVDYDDLDYWTNRGHIEKKVRERWFYCLKHVEAIEKDDDYINRCCAVTFREKDDDDSSLDYPMKWGLEEEITLHTDKSGRSGHETPFQFMERAFILKKVADHDGDQSSLKVFKELYSKFIEFSTVYKGVRQLRYDKGLKSLFALQDDIPAPGAAQGEEEEVISSFFDDFELIKSVNRNEAYKLFKLPTGIYKLKLVADTGNVKEIENFVAEL
jgi:hypothetical protein